MSYAVGATNLADTQAIRDGIERGRQMGIISSPIGAFNLADATAIREALDRLPASTRKKLEVLAIQIAGDSPEADLLYRLITGEGL